MSERITIKFRKSEGALVRLIGLVERKGWEVRGLDLTEGVQDDSTQMKVSLAPRDGTRAIEVLCRHVAKMHDVFGIEINTAPRVLESA
jgi:acetolactate synthase-1/3 small subunit/acetolactate synthase II small subunit